jgi:hypothetical protein
MRSICLQGIQNLTVEGQAFDFLREEEVEYSVEDLKVVF